MFGKKTRELEHKLQLLEIQYEHLKNHPYKESKEFLDRQQKIDYLLVLTRLFLETQTITDTEKEIRVESGKQIQKILESFK